MCWTLRERTSCPGQKPATISSSDNRSPTPTCGFRSLIRNPLLPPRPVSSGFCDRALTIEVATLRRSCPLWVKSRHRKGSAGCPLYPQKRTLIERVRMSALCQEQTLVVIRFPRCAVPQKYGFPLPIHWFSTETFTNTHECEARSQK